MDFKEINDVDYINPDIILLEINERMRIITFKNNNLVTMATIGRESH